MGIIVVEKELMEADIKQARQHYKYYIKITADIKQQILAIGGEYHADAEKILTEKFGSLKQDIWGGGYNIKTASLETNAIINIRPDINPSMEILDADIRKSFLEVAQMKLRNLEKLL